MCVCMFAERFCHNNPFIIENCQYYAYVVSTLGILCIAVHREVVTIAGHSTGHSRCRYLKGRFCLELIRAVNQFC